MAAFLATQCPHCGTLFKLVPDQLKVAEGWVRCGHCQQAFLADDAQPLPTPDWAAGSRAAPRQGNEARLPELADAVSVDRPQAVPGEVKATAAAAAPSASPLPSPVMPSWLAELSLDLDPNLPAPDAEASPTPNVEPQRPRPAPPVASAAQAVGTDVTPPPLLRAQASNTLHEATPLHAEASAAVLREPRMAERAVPSMSAADASSSPSSARARAGRFALPVLVLLAVCVVAMAQGVARLAPGWLVAQPDWLQQSVDRVCGVSGGCPRAAHEPGPAQSAPLAIIGSDLQRQPQGGLQLSVELLNRGDAAVPLPPLQLVLLDADGRTLDEQTLPPQRWPNAAEPLTPGMTWRGALMLDPARVDQTAIAGRVAGYRLQLL